MQTRILDADAVQSCCDVSETIRAVEEAFAAHARGDAEMPAKTYIDLPQYDGDFRAMPGYVDAGTWEAAGLKWINVHPRNPDRHDLPTVLGTMIYSDPETALPLAMMDGRTLTRARTGAAAAVATDHLAPSGARRLGLVGAGAQSHAQLEAISAVRPIEEVVVCDVDDRRAEAFADAHDRGTGTVRTGSVTEAGHCDVLSTVTPATEPVLEAGDVGAQTHINAIGADAPGKRELPDRLLREATIVIDDHAQCVHSGEINDPFERGVLTDADIAADLGSLVAGRTSVPTDGVTVFDSTGLAIQDLAAATVVYRAALEADLGPTIDLHGLA